MFSLRGLRLYFVTLEPCFLPFVMVYLCANVGPLGATRHTACPVLHHSESGPLGLSVCERGAVGSASYQTAYPVCPTLRLSQSHQGNASPLCPGARLRSSYQSGCMFLFYLFGVGLPCGSIFCQFWLCEEAQCVYLRLHLGSPAEVLFLNFRSSVYIWIYSFLQIYVL